MSASTDCIFCSIVAGTAPASRVYEDDHVVGFADIRPFSEGHTLVIPKVHASGLAELDPGLGGNVFRVAQRIALALRRSDLRVDGVNLFLADGAAAWQTVFHVHIHVVPRRKGDNLSVASRAFVRRRGDLERSAEHVRTGLARLAADGR